MASDHWNTIILVAVALATAWYFGKSYIFPQKDSDYAGSVNSGGLRDLVATMANNHKNTIVFYGSQTGTAEDYAHLLSKELLSRFGLKTMTADFAEYDFDNFHELPRNALCLFLMATYGEGDPTDNAVEFMEFLEDEDEDLSNIRFSVFGLGNSTYEFYNAIGKKANTQLELKGAKRFAPHGEGDDGKGSLDEDYMSWKEQVFESLKQNLSIEEHELKYEPGLKLTELEITSDDPSVSQGEPDKLYLIADTDLTKGPFNPSHPYLAKVSSSKELFNSKDRSCVHAEFDVSGSNMRYSTGDHLAVWPSNSNENVATIARALNLTEKLEKVFDLKSLDPAISAPFPTPITYGAVLRHHLEISGPISRQLFASVAAFSPSEEIKANIARIAGDKSTFASEVILKKLNFADALLQFSSAEAWSKIPFEFIIESLPHLQPRFYSISSALGSEKTLIHVTAIVEAEKVGDRPVTGVVTNLLRNIEVLQNNEHTSLDASYDLQGPRRIFADYKLPVHVRRSTFKLPSSSVLPVIMVGPGTGVAPFRGFVRERVQQHKNGANVGPTTLYYGCRSEAEDFLYKEEWPLYAEELGESFKMHVAFSRRDPTKKHYVQDLLLENSEDVFKAIELGAVIYVCGDASKMARDVHSAFVKIVAKGKDVSEDRATEIVRNMKVQNKYQEDVW